MKGIYRNNKLASAARIIMAVIDVFVVISAAAGGYALIFGGGAGMPTSFLAGSIFSSFFWPGMILLFVVGGSHLLVLLTIRNRHYMMEGTAVAGFAILIWIFTELYIIRQAHFLQVLFFALGVINLSLLLFLCEGKRSSA